MPLTMGAAIEVPVSVAFDWSVMRGWRCREGVVGMEELNMDGNARCCGWLFPPHQSPFPSFPSEPYPPSSCSLIRVLVMARPGAATCTVLRPLLEKLAATSRASEAATHLRTCRAGTWIWIQI